MLRNGRIAARFSRAHRTFVSESAGAFHAPALMKPYGALRSEGSVASCPARLTDPPVCSSSSVVRVEGGSGKNETAVRPAQPRSRSCRHGVPRRADGVPDGGQVVGVGDREELGLRGR